MIKKINEINIKYIKGIKNKNFKFDLFPNKPTIFVAPNGFGKSSFTKAFSLLNQNKVNIENKEDSYQNKEENNINSEIVITFENTDGSIENIKATNSINKLFGKIDISVINSSITPKSKGLNSGSGYSISRASLTLPQIVLKNTIPVKKEVIYNYTLNKTIFGKNGKVLINITEIIKNYSLMLKLFNNDNFIKLTNSRQESKIKSWIEHINNLDGNRDDIINLIDTSILGGIFDEFIDIIKNLGFSEKENYILIYQFYKLFCLNKSSIVNIKKYYNYLVFKNNIKEILESIGTTWKEIKAKEIKNKLVLDFPDVRNISNGQRDSIFFLAKLLEIEEKLKFNKPLILIIDEVFDYLDDANLIICQYYITKFIQKFKNESKQIFPIIMTHINPYYFKGYVFKEQKVYFLNSTTTQITNKDLQKIIENRDNNLIQKDLEKYFLHYHTNSCNLEDKFKTLGIKKSLGIFNNYISFIEEEFNSYILGHKGYNPLSICTYLRIKIEEFCYNKLSNQQDKDEFLNIHTSKAKLNFSLEKGIDIPEIFYLLGVIYNDGLHINKNNDWITPLRSKLDNLFIRNMIKEINIIISN